MVALEQPRKTTLRILFSRMIVEVLLAITIGKAGRALTLGHFWYSCRQLILLHSRQKLGLFRSTMTSVFMLPET